MTYVFDFENQWVWSLDTASEKKSTVLKRPIFLSPVTVEMIELIRSSINNDYLWIDQSCLFC